MKTFILALVLILTSVTFSQIDSITITKKYVGILSIGTVDIESDYQTAYYVQFMGGLESRYVFTNNHSLIFRARFTNDEKHYGAFWYEYTARDFTYSIGHMSRQISALIRPTPISFSSHFEPMAYFLIPGGALGMNIGYGDKEISYIGAGISYDDKEKLSELNFGITYSEQDWKIRFAGLISDKRKIVALKTSISDFSIMTCFTADSLQSIHAGYHMSIADPFFVGTYNQDTKKMARYIVGVTKVIKTSYGLKSLIGCGYEPITKEGRIYFMTWLD